MKNDERYKKFRDEGRGEGTNKSLYAIPLIKQGSEPICTQFNLSLGLRSFGTLEMRYYSSPHPGGHITACDGHVRTHAWPYPRLATTISESEALRVCKIQATNCLMLLGSPSVENQPLSSDLGVDELWCLKRSSGATKHGPELANTWPQPLR